MRDLVVVGNGMVGQRLVDEVRRRDHDRQWRITVLGEESRPAYDRVNLSTYFDGVDADALSVVAAGSYDDPSCVLHLDQRVAGVDRDARTVTTDGGRTLHYDALVLATGSYPFVPPVPGPRPARIVLCTARSTTWTRSGLPPSRHMRPHAVGGASGRHGRRRWTARAGGRTRAAAAGACRRTSSNSHLD